MTPQELSDRLWHFAARTAKVVDALPDTRQIVRSGIAPAPNDDEARSGESRADFVHKVNLALITNHKFSMTNSQSRSPKS
jgi:hypothetical protein